MPFGISNSLADFQALDTLRDMLNWFFFVNLNDIMIFSKTLPEHILHDRQVLRCLLKSQLYVKIEKCEFQVSFLPASPYLSSRHPNGPVKIEAVANWPRPTSLKQDQQFLRFSNLYRCFIHNFGAVAAPLTVLI
jgi:hypothetical protein